MFYQMFFITLSFVEWKSHKLHLKISWPLNRFDGSISFISSRCSERWQFRSILELNMSGHRTHFNSLLLSLTTWVLVTWIMMKFGRLLRVDFQIFRELSRMSEHFPVGQETLHTVHKLSRVSRKLPKNRNFPWYPETVQCPTTFLSVWNLFF